MSNYFRITAYNPNEDVAMIVDSNEKFDKLWQFSAFLVSKGFQIIAVGNDSKFTDGNIPKIKERSDKLLLRACMKGKPRQSNSSIEINGKSYEVIK